MALPFAAGMAIPSLTGGAAAASLGTGALAAGGLTSGALAGGAGALQIGGSAALGPASMGFKGAASGLAGGGKGFVDALFGSPKGLAAFGQGISSLGQIAGLMIGGEKGQKVAQSAGMFGLVSGLAPDIANLASAFTNPNTGTLSGTNLQQLGISPNQTFNYSPT